MPNTGSACTGPDKRNQYLREYLADHGYQTILPETVLSTQESLQIASEEERSLLLLLPVAASKELLDSIKKFITRRHIVIGGNLPKDFLSYCREQQIDCIDYLNLPGTAMLNAVATAEGSICEAILASEINLQQSQCLILGFGKCGEILADKLHALNAYVSISTRNPEARAKALAYGYQLHGQHSSYSQYDFIFNTAPAPVINRNIIDQLKKECIIIDIASKPGGTDFDYCVQKGITAKHCLSLPGKYAPKTSAKLIYNQLEPILKGSRGQI
ncbi:MAG: hypothetical protein LUH14_12420 [Clostridiaceae bacterium]|nr:hypothetical protein [Clostridiaceae bacterium]